MTDKKVIVVTGASQGLGAAVASLLGKLGVAVALIARSSERLKVLSHDMEKDGGIGLAIPADIANPDDCRDAVNFTLRHLGRIDALVNNAGVFGPVSSIADTDVHQWRHNVQVNLVGPFYMIHYAIPALREARGRIVNVSSGAANQPILAASAYCASKAGLTHFTKILAGEEPMVTSVSMRPGVVDTPMQALIRREGPTAMPPEQAAYYLELKRSRRLEPPQVPAKAIAWLALHAPREWSGRFLNYDDPEIRGAMV